jgi:hypothetical protein
MKIRATLLLAVVLVSGCDAWPTTVDNRSAQVIQFQWHHRDYDKWSAPVDLPSGKATRLALNQYAEDFTGVRISDNGRTYPLTPAAIARLHKFCSRSAIERSFNVGGDCWLTYHGNGWVSVSRHAEPDINYEESANAS